MPILRASGGGSHSEQRGLFKLSGHICIEKNIPVEGQ